MNTLLTPLIESVEAMLRPDGTLTPPPPQEQRVFIEYGRMSIVEPMCAAQMRTVIIGDSMARIRRWYGDVVFTDMQMRDGGLSIVLVMCQLQCEQPTLMYFASDQLLPYPVTPPLSFAAAVRLLRVARARPPSDQAFWTRVDDLITRLDSGEYGIVMLWTHLVNTAIRAYKAQFARFGFHVDFWQGERDSQPYLVGVDDTPDLPAREKLGALLQRTQEFAADQIVYIAPQAAASDYQHFFDAVRARAWVAAETRLDFIGVGTITTSDGAPFATDEDCGIDFDALYDQLRAAAARHLQAYPDICDTFREYAPHVDIAAWLGVASWKFAALLRVANRESVFDADHATRLNGYTGAYLLYTLAHIASTLRYARQQAWTAGAILPPEIPAEGRLLELFAQFPRAVERAYASAAPHDLALYACDLAHAYHAFAVKCRPVRAVYPTQRAGWLGMIRLGGQIFRSVLSLLGLDTTPSMECYHVRAI
ncbi:MAG: DALR anticodon-binding domain-containing protein [Chloroflexota bacterium]|nr:DALR anticodon-binding domain-containing protein [Chloroflexota bacterium]